MTKTIKETPDCWQSNTLCQQSDDKKKNKMESLKDKTAKGLLWGGLNSGMQQVVGLAFGIVLGRLLAPPDYGMMAMISIFSLIATALQDSGFRTALTNLK